MEKKSPNLEVISSPEGVEKGETSERRRRLRLNLSAEQFRLGANGKIFSVADLSVNGMALRILESEDLKHFPVATRIRGVLNLKGLKHPVEGQVVRIGGDVVGCQFLDLSPAVREALESFLDPSALGREIKPIPAGDPYTLWYHGPSGTDLVFRRGVDGQYRKVTLFIQGSYIQWDEEEGLSTGLSRASEEQSEVRGVVRLETLFLDEDSPLDPGKLRIAKELVLSSNLPQDLKKWCTRHFSPS